MEGARAVDWITIGIQAGGAIGVCAMFLWFLLKKQDADDTARREFLDHLSGKDVATASAIDKNMEYLRERDKQSKELAKGGFESLGDLTGEFRELRGSIHSMLDKPKK